MRLFHELWKFISMLDQNFREELGEDYTAKNKNGLNLAIMIW